MSRMLFFLAVYLAVPAMATADPISLTTTAFTSADIGSGPTTTCSSAGTSSAVCSASVQWVDRLGRINTASQSATASASLGSLEASVGHFTSGGLDLPNFSLKATAEFGDELVVAGVGSGFIQYLFEGTVSSFTDPAGVGNGFLFSHDGSALQGFQILSIVNVPPLDFSYVSPLMPFQYGLPFELYVFAQGSTASGVHDGAGLGSVAVTLSGFNFFDASGAPTDATISSAAGAPYAVPIPEPATLLLIGGGLLIGACRRRRSSM